MSFSWLQVISKKKKHLKIPLGLSICDCRHTVKPSNASSVVVTKALFSLPAVSPPS